MIRRKYLNILLLLIWGNVQLIIAQENRELPLDSCIKISLQNNYELKVYEQNKNIAFKQYELQKSALFPTVSLNSEYTITDQYDELDTYNAGNASIQIYQPVWQNGKIKTAVKRAKANTEASNIQYIIDRNNIIYYTSGSYINVLRNNKIRALTNKMLKQFAITVDAAKERFELGISKRSDMLKAETEYSNVNYLSIQSATAEKIAMQNLLKTMGYEADTSFIAADFLGETSPTIETLGMDSLIAIAKDFLPEFKLIDKRIQQQELSVLIEKKNQYPEIGAFANYNWIDNPLIDKEFYGSAGLSLRFTIFSGFKKKKTIAMEKVKLEQLNYQQDEIIQSVLTEIQIAHVSLLDAREKIGNAQARMKSAKEALKVVNEEYLQGLSSMLELIDAQYTDFEAKRNLINAQAEYQLALLTLKRRTGLLNIQYNP